MSLIFLSIHLKDGIQNELAEGAGKFLAIRTGGSLTELPGIWIKISVYKLSDNIMTLR